MTESIGRHTRGAEGLFQDTEAAMVYAFDDASGRNVYLPDGIPVAYRRDYRSWVKADLRCPFKDCGAHLTVKFCADKRDHFAHLPRHGIDHSPESFFHQRGKAVVAEWVERQVAGGFRVETEAALPAAQGARRPDVTITSPTGWRVFVEIQYASLKPEDWLERHRDLTSDGDAAVWLLGHVGVHATVKGGAIKLSPLVQEMANNDVVPLWIDPMSETVVTAFGKRDNSGPYGLRGERESRDHQPPQALDTCELTRDGIMTRRLKELMAAESQRSEARQETDKKEHQRLADLAARQAQRGQWKQTWLRSIEWTWLQQRHGGRHWFIKESEQSTRVGDAFGRDAMHWQVLIYRYLVEVAPAEWVTYEDLLRRVAGDAMNSRLDSVGHSEVRRLLGALEWEQGLAVQRFPDQRRIARVCMSPAEDLTEADGLFADPKAADPRPESHAPGAIQPDPPTSTALSPPVHQKFEEVAAAKPAREAITAGASPEGWAALVPNAVPEPVVPPASRWWGRVRSWVINHSGGS